MRSLVIAVDGYAATGKSTTARLVAEKLGYTFIDTGAMYRAVTLYMVRHNIPIGGEMAAFHNALGSIELDFRLNDETGRLDMYMNDENVEEAIRQMDVAGKVSEVAAVGAVRDRLVALQRQMGAKGGVVMDGRDIGTVVFPYADLKVFLTADMEVRVSRRLAQLAKKGEEASREEVRENLAHRDHIDSSRLHSPLRKAHDAIEIDTSNLTIPEQVVQVVAMAEELLVRKYKD